MSPELHILRDLSAGPTTADSLAPRVRLQTEAAAIILARLQREGKVSSEPLAKIESLLVYRLTVLGKEAIVPSSLKTGN
jgi:DNA-binding HxlR family transcriptional regulator